MRIPRPSILLLPLLATLVFAAPARAQQTIFRDGFDGAATGWQRGGLWAIDGSPSSIPGGVAFSAPRSLNFNNGVDYAGLQRAACQSPSIAARAAVDHVLRFRCNYRTETTGTAYDRRTVVIRVNGTTVATNRLSGVSTAPAGSRCAAMGTWHPHEMAIPVGAATVPPTIRVEFAFDSVDSYSNGFPGWFVDDVEVASTGAPAGPAFDTLSRTTSDFRSYNVTTRVLASRSVEVLQSSPTARYAPISGQATAAEWQALVAAVQSANLASIPAGIPDPNVYIVAPTTFTLDVVSAIPANDNTIAGSLGVYGQWSAQLAPVMTAVQAIQTRLLAGPTPTGDDHGNTPQAATTLDVTSQQATPGAIAAAGDADFFKVSDPTPVIAIYPPPQRTYTVETTVSGNMDTMIDLYAADGTTLLAVNDDAPGFGLASRVSYTTAHGTTLYARVRHYGATGTGSYTIRATGGAGSPGPSPTQDDHGNAATSASAVVVGGPAVAGSIETAGDVDYFGFSAFSMPVFPLPPVTFTIQTTVAGGTDTVIELYASDGTTLLAANDDFPGLGYASKITYSGTVATGYYVKVRHYGATGTGGYTVTVKTTP